MPDNTQEKPAAASSDYVIVVSLDTTDNTLKYREKKTGADASELQVTHGKHIEWQPEQQGAHEIEIDFAGGGNPDSPFDGDQPQTEKSRHAVHRRLRTLSAGSGLKRYKYNVTLTHEGGSQHEDPVVIIGE